MNLKGFVGTELDHRRYLSRTDHIWSTIKNQGPGIVSHKT